MQQVIVTFSTAPDEVMLRLFRRCEEMGVTVAFVPRLFEKVTARLTVDYLGALPLLAARTPNPRGLQFAVKYTVDRLLAAGLLLLAAPFLIFAALGVWATLGRPILFRQKRVGRDGREFEMLKFRTMREASGTGTTRSSSSAGHGAGRSRRRRPAHKLRRVPPADLARRGSQAPGASRRRA